MTQERMTAQEYRLRSVGGGRNVYKTLIAPGSEDEIQADFFKWVDTYKDEFPELDLIYAIPNAGFASKKQGALRKLTGRRSGVPDVHLPFETVMYIGLWIEFKRPGETPTVAQLLWIAKLRKARHRVEVCTSWHEAANFAVRYLQLPLDEFK